MATTLASSSFCPRSRVISVSVLGDVAAAGACSVVASARGLRPVARQNGRETKQLPLKSGG